MTVLALQKCEDLKNLECLSLKRDYLWFLSLFFEALEGWSLIPFSLTSSIFKSLDTISKRILHVTSLFKEPILECVSRTLESLRFAPALSVFSFLVLFLLGRDSHAYLSLVSWTLLACVSSLSVSWLQLVVNVPLIFCFFTFERLIKDVSYDRARNGKIIKKKQTSGSISLRL